VIPYTDASGAGEYKIWTLSPRPTSPADRPGQGAGRNKTH
jgi:hypothetical protein